MGQDEKADRLMLQTEGVESTQMRSRYSPYVPELGRNCKDCVIKKATLWARCIFRKPHPGVDRDAVGW